jgi:predicted nucleic acid-binding protein
VLLRWSFRHEPLHPLVFEAVKGLRHRGESVYITAQNLVEFWNAATRPRERNGFGYSPSEAYAEVQRVRPFFQFAADRPEIFEEWLKTVAKAGVSGVKVHDARLAAAMRVYGISHILTMNAADFERFPGITVVEPKDVPS